ncbi:hypothetical protein CPB84DRAFT_1743355 [Gymnopilus junonius]|uniref:Uncharacterized protein n=1 Tax=Gymnopilus junonius TaxID=109634 RepID=A0A9P5NY04_GYMJU|nr:hypothetical protein CPB84DRAFT_1743355 [Gymnopilus junonius]
MPGMVQLCQGDFQLLMEQEEYYFSKPHPLILNKGLDRPLNMTIHCIHDHSCEVVCLKQQRKRLHFEVLASEFEIQIMFTMPSLSVESKLSNKQRKLKELKNRS